MPYSTLVYNSLNDDLLNKIKEFIPYSSVPVMNIDSDFIRLFNKYLIHNWNPLFIEVTKSNETIGVVPLMYLNSRRKGIIPYRRLRFFASTWSDFCDVYAKNEKDKVEVIRITLDWLFSGGFRWEEMVLDDLPEETGIVKPLVDYLDANKMNFKVEEGKYFHINLERKWDEVKGGMSNSFVWKNVRLAKNRITNAGKWEILYNPVLTADEIMQGAKIVHNERQKELGRASSMNDKNVYAFYTELIDAYLRKHEFNTFWLLFEDKVIAYMLGFYFNNVFYWWNTAFLPEYKDFYPTRLLQYHALKYMHSNGYKEFNFMRGELGYKDKWTSTTRSNYRFRIIITEAVMVKPYFIWKSFY